MSRGVTSSQLNLISKECLYFTLLGIITVGLLTTGKNKNREKYGEIAQNPPHYPGRNFTCAKPFNFKIAEITKITEI